ncbi:unnamed protein product (macronuclear) [Paramecium tetraurelia]|uniref:ZZ-type domain-containing protein n=1 Tax=Paramecium tetraurelia TaxID=5888 RepID=A0CF37_PARTE|nr:uncharacterized protein GSPATT00037843001 [Paramecium tetraurelia]CAK69404.1 unnamed protein product [Paramecium tetraurelia]|eukprot:XP_001436801.1 hypothetical protein (macronuclear) [Paramecium tetraurelia strain d4-2]
MKHLKLSIPCMNQSFLYKGNFLDINYEELVKFAESKLGKKLTPELYFVYVNVEGDNFVIDNDHKLNNLKKLNSQVLKIILKEFERQVVLHPNTICSVCQQSPIQNIRHKCVVCEDVDLCQHCSIEHSRLHPLIMISKPEQVIYLESFFKKHMKKVKNILNCSISKSKSTVIAIKDVIMKKKQDYFGNVKQQQDQQIDQGQFKKPPSPEEEDVLNKTLRLSEIFEGQPSTYEKFVKQNKELTFEELVEKASEKFA